MDYLPKVKFKYQVTKLFLFLVVVVGQAGYTIHVLVLDHCLLVSGFPRHSDLAKVTIHDDDDDENNGSSTELEDEIFEIPFSVAKRL